MNTNNTANQELRLNTVEQVARNLASYLSHRCECDECGYAIASSFKVIQTDMENLLKEHTRPSHPTPDREVMRKALEALRQINFYSHAARCVGKRCLDPDYIPCSVCSIRMISEKNINALEAVLGGGK